MKKQEKGKLFLPKKFKWGNTIQSSWSSVFISSDDEIENIKDYKKFFINLQKRQANLTSVIGGMKFLEIYSLYAFERLYLFDINVNEFSKMQIFFKYLLETKYEDYDGQVFLENYINKNFKEFYLPKSLQSVDIVKPKNFLLPPDKTQTKTNINFFGEVKNSNDKFSLDMIFRPSVYPDFIWKPSKQEYEQVQENLKHSWPEYHFEIPKHTSNDVISFVYDSHIPWDITNSVFPYQSKSIFKLIYHFFIGGIFCLFVLDTLKFNILPYLKRKKYLFQRQFSFRTVLRTLTFSLFANKLWQAEQKLFPKSIIIHDTRHAFGTEKNQYNLFKKRYYLEPDRLWDKTLSFLIDKNNKNGLQVWSEKNHKLINDNTRNYFVKESCSINDFENFKNVINKFDFIVFHNIISNHENKNILREWLLKCEKFNKLKIIISEHIIDQAESNIDDIISGITQRSVLKLAYSGGLNCNRRNKFYVF